MNGRGPDAVQSSAFRLLVDQVEDYAIFLLDPKGRVATWNAGAERIKGYSEAEIQGQHFSTFYPEEACERNVPERELAIAIDEGRVEDYGWRVRKDGSLFWAHVVITALWDGNELKGFGKVTQDLGEETRLNEILDRINDAFVAFDDELRYTYLNERATELLGYRKEALLGRKSTDVFPSVAGSRIHEELHRALETQESVTFQHDSPLLNCWLEMRIFPSENGLSVYFQDITEQKVQAERLQEEKALVEQIFDVSPIAIAVFDAEGTVIRSNERAKELFGDDERSIVGRSLTEATGVLFDEQGPIPLSEYPIQQVFDEGKSVLGYTHGVRMNDGTHRWVSTNFAPMLDEDGDVVRVVVTIEDISELKKNERLLQQQQAELDETIADLKRSNSELEHFAYAASHDLREPLRMVSSYLDLLERRDGDTLSEDGREFLEYAHDGAQRLNRMINDLLAYSRVSRQFVDVEPVDFEEVVDLAIQNLTVAIDHTGAEITVDSLPTVKGSETLLVQLMQNLLGNAIMYSEETPQVYVSVEDDDQEWVFSVRDEGVGIAPEEVDKVFEIFYGNGVDGAGIGLAICQKIVELHRGRIWVDSTLGEGSTFYVALPK